MTTIVYIFTINYLKIMTFIIATGKALEEYLIELVKEMPHDKLAEVLNKREGYVKIGLADLPIRVLPVICEGKIEYETRGEKYYRNISLVGPANNDIGFIVENEEERTKVASGKVYHTTDTCIGDPLQYQLHIGHNGTLTRIYGYHVGKSYEVELRREFFCGGSLDYPVIRGILENIKTHVISVYDIKVIVNCESMIDGIKKIFKEVYST